MLPTTDPAGQPGCQAGYHRFDAIRQRNGLSPRRRWWILSLALHLLVAGRVVMPESIGRAGDSRQWTKSAVPIFLPPLGRTRPPEPETLSISSAGVRSPAPADGSEVKVELTSLRISFARDTTNQLTEVVRGHEGMLALLDKEDPTVARYLFAPPGWEAEETIADISGKMRIMMEPSREWPVFRALADRFHLSLDRYVACALFDVSYRRCLVDAIKDRAPKPPAGIQTQVASARLAFSSNNPCGIQVLEVRLAEIPTH